jgi:DNA-binding GntR family transcriptional regulator
VPYLVWHAYQVWPRELWEDDQVTEPVGRPAYQEVADDLKRRIASAEFPVGSAIPSTAKLTKRYGVSSTVVRAAVAQLRGDGLLIGQPGKGVFVRATPEAVAQRAASIEDLTKQVEELRTEMHRIESDRRDEVAAEFAALGQLVRSLQAHLADLYAQLGRPIPDGLADLPGVAPPAG